MFDFCVWFPSHTEDMRNCENHCMERFTIVYHLDWSVVTGKDLRVTSSRDFSIGE